MQKIVFFFLYSSVFYTINHLDIYRYVYCTYMFWESPFFFDEKKNKTKKTATPFHQSMQVCIKQIMACKPQWVQLFVQSIVYDQTEEKLSNK